MNSSKRLFLTGFSGSGKSYFGRPIGQALKLPFFDLDVEVESKAGMRIGEIFAMFGENHFRNLEASALLAIARREEFCLALGGGTLLNPNNRRIVSDSGCCIWLRENPNTSAQRARKESNRPLLETNKDGIENLWQERLPGYQTADQVVDLADDSGLALKQILLAIGKCHAD
jgi:shikimate kinase